MQSTHGPILGISCYYHDAAATIVIDGKVVAAVQEERFTRKKHDEQFPHQAVAQCLKIAGLSMNDIAQVVFYEKPILKFERLLQMYIADWPWALPSFLRSMQIWFKDKLWMESRIREALGFEKDILFAEHHYAHAASAYYASPFQDAIVITMDGVGEWDTATIGHAKENRVTLSHTIAFPDSLGLLYSALTYYLGFKVNSAEYKVMGLAPYGNPETYMEAMRKLIDVKPDGSFRLNMKYFGYTYGFRMTNRAFDKLFGGPPRRPESPLTQREKDIAASLQALTEEVVLKIVSHARSLYPDSKNICLAGGVALNCVANGKILKQKWFDGIYIQPAAGDAGGAVGAALYVAYDVMGQKKEGSAMPDAFLGNAYTDEAIETFLTEILPTMMGGQKVQYTKLSDGELASRVAALIEGDNVIGWFQGRMEFGPRALGNRSILADPRNKENWQKVNLKIKFRESFRPFAPAVIEERTREYFDLAGTSPYMLLVAPVTTDTIPAVTHVDHSARIQTVSEKENHRFYQLLQAFYRRTGCAVLINTSFNVRGEPIVESPHNAFLCFINTHMDYLVLGNYLIAKKDNKHFMDENRLREYLNTFELD